LGCTSICDTCHLDFPWTVGNWDMNWKWASIIWISLKIDMKIYKYTFMYWKVKIYWDGERLILWKFCLERARCSILTLFQHGFCWSCVRDPHCE
jgi:hypothetical protein